MGGLVRGVADDYIIRTLHTEGPKVMGEVIYNPPPNSRRPRQEYGESNRVMVDTVAEVARRAHLSRAEYS